MDRAYNKRVKKYKADYWIARIRERIEESERKQKEKEAFTRKPIRLSDFGIKLK